MNVTIKGKQIEFKGTPGDWKVADSIEQGTGKRFLAVWNEATKNGELSSPLCLISEKSDETAKDLADAQLIASAPKMFESLKMCAYLFQQIREQMPDSPLLSHIAYQMTVSGVDSALLEAVQDLDSNEVDA